MKTEKIGGFFRVALWTTLMVGISMTTGCGGGGGSAPPPPPTLSLSQSTVTFSSAFGGSNPAAASVNVTNAGTGMLNFTAASDSPWLSVTPASGTAPQALQISAALGSLTTANYTGHITVTAAGAQGSPATINVTFVVGGPSASNAPFWAQWGANPQHAGMVDIAGQKLANQLANVVYDPFAPQEEAENEPRAGQALLTVHYQVPIIDGNDVYIVEKTGSYTSCKPVGAWTSGAACGPNTWNTMIWNEMRLTWENGQLIEIWCFASDWKPETNGRALGGWEPVFHAVDANNFIYVPGAGGTIWKVDKNTGKSVSHINPFNGVSIDAKNTFVSSPLTADSSGNIYYNVIELSDPSQGDPWRNDVPGAWLVKVTPSDSPSTVTYATLLPGAPAASSDTCPLDFSYSDSNGSMLPWPPSVSAAPPTTLCGSQRPGVNIAPAAAPDGTIYTVSRAHLDPTVAYLIAVKPDLTVKSVTSLQYLLNDGCGVNPNLPIAPPGVTNEPNSCRNGTTVGVDPTTNAKSSASIYDQASSSPTVLPDGSILFGAVTGYNSHLLKFDAQGNFLAGFDFGWDSTPAVYTHSSTYSIVIKDQRPDLPVYCTFNNPVCQPPPQPTAFYITQLDPNMQIEWRFLSTNTMSCHRNPDGSKSCVSDHPNGFEWCINAPAIDINGMVYANSEDGNAYAIPQGNSGVFATGATSFFLNETLGAAYTPLSIGPDGKIYAENNGQMFVVGN